MTTNNTSDGKSNKDIQDTLMEPLLPLVEAVADGDTTATHHHHKHCRSVWPMVRTKLVTSLMGCGMAVLSHSLLSMVLWNDSILRAGTVDIVIFSMSWSFWTCVILFLGMIAFVSSSFGSSNSNSNNNNNSNNAEDEDEEHEDDRAFQIEAQYVVASLLTITAIWMLDSILWSFLLVVVVLCLILAVGLQDQTVLASYSLVAGTLGLIFGACSQFLLSLWMWRDLAMTQPIIDHIVWFSLACSSLTVVMTFCGCLSLRWIVAGGSRSSSRSQQLNHDSNTTNNRVQDRRRRQAILRMEAVYVAMTLVGICSAWIFLDVTAGLPEQVLPSLLMLSISLVAFTLILQCFPEEDCLEQEVEAVVESISKYGMISTDNNNNIIVLVTTTPTKTANDNDILVV